MKKITLLFKGTHKSGLFHVEVFEDLQFKTISVYKDQKWVRTYPGIPGTARIIARGLSKDGYILEGLDDGNE